MNKILFALLALALAASAHHSPIHNLHRKLRSQTPEQNAKHTWAVLVAGSTGWSNYRHQADVCHAYQLLHRVGVPDEHIIVFMYDDLARSATNPYPGKIFNDFVTKTSADVDVYEGVPHDYNGRNATAANLLSVLSGEVPLSGSGKTLASTEEDNVFFYYDDHGNVDLIAMPYGGYFYSKDLTAALEAMTAKKMFKNFMIFIQACESGSMIYKQNLPDNVYVATSAPVYESAYACNYDSVLRTYIASCWPYGWMKEIEASGADATIDHVLNVAYKFALNKSGTRPCQYGDVDLKRYTFREYFAPEDSDNEAPKKAAYHKGVHAHHSHHHKAGKHAPAAASFFYDESACPQYDVPYQIAKRNYENSKTQEDYIELQRQIEIRKKVEKVLYKVVDAALPANDAASGYFKTPVCTTCDESCECIAACEQQGYSSEDCKLHCCGYSGCTGSKPPYPDYATCEANLASKFESACGHINNDYIYVAGKFFGRLCRYPQADINAAIEAMRGACAAY